MNTEEGMAGFFAERKPKLSVAWPAGWSHKHDLFFPSSGCCFPSKMCEVCIQRAEGSLSQGHNQKLLVYDLQPCFLIVCIYFKCCHYRSWDREKCGQDSWACCCNTYFVLPRVEPTGWAQHVLTQSRLLKEAGLGPQPHKKTSPDSPVVWRGGCQERPVIALDDLCV